MIFLDSSVIIAYKIKNDVNHAKAVKIIKRISECDRVIVSEYVFAEVVTVLSLKENLKTAVNVGKGLRNAKEVEILEVGNLFEEAWKIFREKGKCLSFVDCSSIAIMKNMGITRIATFDKDFKQIKNIAVINE
jgi:predicted nucleic acid-binding protein